MVVGGAVQEPVRAAIWYALNNYNYEDAVFLAERLHAEVCSRDSVYLLATCYYRSGRVQQARYLLRGEGAGRDAKSELLYARCCLDLNDLKAGLLALSGLLCLREVREEEVVSHFQEDSGVAFWLLGELNRRLHNLEVAAKHFRRALKYNPFLWTAFHALCEMGEKVVPEECFQIHEYPRFLKSHLLPGTTQCFQEPSLPKPVVQGAQRAPMEGNKARKAVFNLTPVDAGKAMFTTPDLFAGPFGKAVASSTPLPRTLQFTQTDVKDTEEREKVTPACQNGEDRTQRGQGGMSTGRLTFGHLRVALNFGSGSVTGSVGGGGGGGGGGGRGGMGHATPFTPSFGVLPVLTPTGSAHLPTATQALNFSTVTPSPTPLPRNYLTLLQSAPKSTRGAMFADQGSPESTHIPTPLSIHFTPPVGETPSQPEGTQSDQTAPSEDDLTSQTAPSCGDTPAMPPPKAPIKSSLRRSPRLSTIGKSPSSMANSRRRSELAPSSLALHSTRAKSKQRFGKEAPGRKGAKVTFTTPVTSRKIGPRKSYPLTPEHARQETTPPPGPKEEEISHQEDGGGGGWGVRGEGCVEERGGAVSQEMEQAMMASIASLMHLLCQLGSAYKALCSYDLVSSLHLLRSLPSHQSHTPWALSLVGRAYFVGERFREAAKVFEDVHKMDPHRQEDMELYASTLWHQQREVELSSLAERLHSSDKRRPEGLCAMASVMNIYRDHESAVKFLQRAIQVSPHFTYAHTLLGHEYWLVKDYDKALASFQTATTLNPRQYNAWYGMAHVYFAQEKYQFAELYARRALAVNQSSSIACTQLSLAQFRQNNLDGALCSLERAIALHRHNPIPKFHRAKVLEAMGRLEEALVQLEELTASWPKEPNLYISKGKILKKLGRPHEAVLQFSWALDFRRSGSQSNIREEIDQVYRNQDLEEEEQQDNDFVVHPDSSESEEEDPMQS